MSKVRDINFIDGIRYYTTIHNKDLEIHVSCADICRKAGMFINFDIDTEGIIVPTRVYKKIPDEDKRDIDWDLFRSLMKESLVLYKIPHVYIISEEVYSNYKNEYIPIDLACLILIKYHKNNFMLAYHILIDKIVTTIRDVYLKMTDFYKEHEKMIVEINNLKDEVERLNKELKEKKNVIENEYIPKLVKTERYSEYMDSIINNKKNLKLYTVENIANIFRITEMELISILESFGILNDETLEIEENYKDNCLYICCCDDNNEYTKKLMFTEEGKFEICSLLMDNHFDPYEDNSAIVGLYLQA